MRGENSPPRFPPLFFCHLRENPPPILKVAACHCRIPPDKPAVQSGSLLPLMLYLTSPIFNGKARLPKKKFASIATFVVSQKTQLKVASPLPPNCPLSPNVMGTVRSAKTHPLRVAWFSAQPSLTYPISPCAV